MHTFAASSTLRVEGQLSRSFDAGATMWGPQADKRGPGSPAVQSSLPQCQACERPPAWPPPQLKQTSDSWAKLRCQSAAMWFGRSVCSRSNWNTRVHFQTWGQLGQPTIITNYLAPNVTGSRWRNPTLEGHWQGDLLKRESPSTVRQAQASCFISPSSVPPTIFHI